MLYEMLTGRPPFEGDSPLAVMNARVVGDPEPPRSVNPPSRANPRRSCCMRWIGPLGRHPTARALGEELNNPGTVEVTGRRNRVSTASALPRHGPKVAVGYPSFRRPGREVPVAAALSLFVTIFF